VSEADDLLAVGRHLKDWRHRQNFFRPLGLIKVFRLDPLHRLNLNQSWCRIRVFDVDDFALAVGRQEDLDR